MRKILLVAIIVISVGALFLFGRARLSGHRIELKANFLDAQGLRAGASVRVAGVDVGSVTSVRVRPELRDNPAEIVMGLRTPYELKIPRDSIVSLATAGVLGPTFVEIDVTGASGEPATNGTVLKARETEAPSTQQLIDKITNAVQRIQRKPCDNEPGDADSSSSVRKERGSGQKKSVVK